MTRTRYKDADSEDNVGLLSGQQPTYLDSSQDSTTRPVNFSNANQRHTWKALENIVGRSLYNMDLSHSIHAHSTSHIPFFRNLESGLENFANKYHFGNYVAIRGTDKKFFESMPLYERIGMHLLFYGHVQIKVLQTEAIESLLREESIKVTFLLPANCSPIVANMRLTRPWIQIFITLVN